MVRVFGSSEVWPGTFEYKTGYNEKTVLTAFVLKQCVF